MPGTQKVPIKFLSCYSLCACAELLFSLWLFATPADCSPCQTSLSAGILQQGYWSGLPCCPPGGLPNPGIKPVSPALQGDSLPSEPPGKSKNTGVGGLSLLQGIFLTQELNQGLLHWRRILYQLSCQGSPFFSLGLINTHLIEFIFLINGKHLLWNEDSYKSFCYTRIFSKWILLKTGE